MTVTETAERLGRSPLSVYRLLKRGLLPRDPNSRHIAIPAWAVDGYIENAGNLKAHWWEQVSREFKRQKMMPQFTPHGSVPPEIH